MRNFLLRKLDGGITLTTEVGMSIAESLKKCRFERGYRGENFCDLHYSPFIVRIAWRKRFLSIVRQWVKRKV